MKSIDNHGILWYNSNMKSKLTEIRKKLQLNQKEFAEQLGLTRSIVANIESGRTNLTNSRKMLICKVFRINKEWFTDSSQSMFIDLKDEIATDNLNLIVKILKLLH